MRQYITILFEYCLVTLNIIQRCAVNGRYRILPAVKSASKAATMIVPPTTPPNPSELYYFEDGFRRVRPYYHTYNTNCKERWRNRELLDIFASEFRDRTPEYYVRLRADFSSHALKMLIRMDVFPSTETSH